MLNSKSTCLLTNTLYLWNPQPGQKTLETLSGTVPVSAFCSVYWGLSLSSPPPPPPHSCPSGGIPGKRKIFNFNSPFTQHVAGHLMTKNTAIMIRESGHAAMQVHNKRLIEEEGKDLKCGKNSQISYAKDGTEERTCKCWLWQPDCWNYMRYRLRMTAAAEYLAKHIK